MNKFTDGPWEVIEQGKIDGLNFDGCRVKSVAHISDSPAGGITTVIAEIIDEDDARLIAAAPDLLAALQDAEFLMRQAGKIAGPMQDSFNRSSEDARSAIAKATQ